MRDKRWVMFLIAAVVVAADRLSKMWVVKHVISGLTIPVLPRVPTASSWFTFQISHVLNTGAAFSMFEGGKHPDMVRQVLIWFSVVAVLVVVGILLKAGRDLTLMSVSLALILGGAIGNLYDRVHLKYVVDFLEVNIVHYHWPDFNVADSAICVGACLLLLEMLRPQDVGSRK